MSLLSSYATAAEYRSRVNMQDTSSDAEILAQLTAVSRMLEYELRVCPGFFNVGSPGEVRYFTPPISAGRVLRLVDERGLQHCISTIATDGIAVDTDNDGTYNYTVDPTGETWVVPRPYNAAGLGEPWDTLELLSRSAATFSSWPPYPKGVRLTGTWGWAAVPGIVLDLTVKLTRDMRDSQEAGAAGTLAGVAVKTDTWRFWLSARQQYGNPSLVVA